MRGEKLRANLPLFWNNDGKDRPKGQICPPAKEEVFVTTDPEELRPPGVRGLKKKKKIC